MKEEKKIILQLLEEQKINKDEALKLLDALDKAKETSKNKIDINKSLDSAKKKFEDVSFKAGKKYEELKPEIKKASKKTKNNISEMYKDLSNIIGKKSEVKDEIIDINENVESNNAEKKDDSVIELGTNAQPIKRIPENSIFEDGK